MIKYELFEATRTTASEVSDFFNEHLIDHHKILDNGDIAIFYREIDDLGLDNMDRLERINNAIKEAETNILDAELGLAECDGNKADLDELIAGSNPNEKEKWETLQNERKENENQRRMHEKTIEGRKRQVFDLRAGAQEILATKK